MFLRSVQVDTSVTALLCHKKQSINFCAEEFALFCCEITVWEESALRTYQDKIEEEKKRFPSFINHIHNRERKKKTMTTATVTAPVASDAAAVARKRRREIMLSQRAAANNCTAPTTMSASPLVAATVLPTPTVVVPDAPPSSSFAVVETPSAPVDFVSTEVDDPPATKKQRTGAPSSKKQLKKPQMRYDPDVPMTKEEAAIWRREQRRKRNRESAAASRQRQRDRIAELETELNGWKHRYEEVMAKIAQHQETVIHKGTADLIDSLPSLPSPASPVIRRVSDASTIVSQPPSPTPATPTFVTTSSKDQDLPVTPAIVVDSDKEEEENEATLTNHINTMISRPAQSRIANLIPACGA